MSEIAKGVLGGAWTLLVGWIFPAFLVLEVALILWLPAVAGEEPFSRFVSQKLDEQQLQVLLISVAVGFLLAALQTPLYKVLEGYWLWPKHLKERGIARQTRERDRLIDEAIKSGEDIEPNYWVQMRFSSAPNQVAPTAFGNAMRRFETYAIDRYYLDSQTFWHHLAASAPDYVVKAEASARTNVDFAVALSWMSSSLAAAAGITWITRLTNLWLVVLFFLAVISAYGAYRMAVLGTDEWAAAVRAQVDLGRVKLAQTMGFELPETIHYERMLWSNLNYFVKAPYERSKVDAELNRFRVPAKKDNQEPKGSSS